MNRPRKARTGLSRNLLRKTRQPEIEVKLPVSDRQVLLARLHRLRASGGKRVHEMNTLYDKPDRQLLREGKMFRIRVETATPFSSRNVAVANVGNSPRSVRLTYKGPGQPGEGFANEKYKIREEREVGVEDAVALARILEGFGLEPSFRYEKYRSAYHLPRLKGLLLEFDETPIGDFLELEGPPGLIDRAAAMLGFGPADYITKSYAALFVESQRAARASQNLPNISESYGDMLFRPAT